MRQHVIDTISAFIGTYTGFRISSELPFEKDGSPLYLSNFKTVYVDDPQITVEPLHEFVSGTDIDQNITDVRAYLVVDAKNAPSNLDAFLSALRNVKYTVPTGVFRSLVDHNTTIDNDTVTHEFVYTYIKIT